MSIVKSNNYQLPPAILDARAHYDPDGVWAKYPTDDTTYKLGFTAATNSQVANAVNTVAWTLKKLVCSNEDFPTVAYLGPNDLRYYIVILAGMKVGCKTFLPSPRNSNVAQVALLSGLSCKLLITPDPAPACVPPILEEYSMEQCYIPDLQALLSSSTVPKYPWEKTFADARHEPVLVLHTSGSTGIPKPLIYTNEFATRFVNALTLPAPEGYVSLLEKTQTGSFLSFLPPFHVAGVGFSFWAPLFSNSTPVYPLPGKPPSTQDFLEAVEYADFDWAFLVPVILDELSRDTSALELVSRKLKYLFYTGGSLPTVAAEILTQNIPVFPCLGSSEAAGLPLIHPREGSSADACMYVQPHAAANIEFRHRYDESYEMIIVKSTETEHCQPVFEHFPELKEFETRDLFARHPTRPGAFKHQGRVDDIIVFINGEKTNPVTFEQQVGRHPEIRSALVAGSQRFEACILIELLDSSSQSSQEQHEIVERIWPVIKQANRHCPSHAKVSKDRILFTDPNLPMLRAGKGTVQRQATLNLYAQKIDKLYTVAEVNETLNEGPADVELSDLSAIASVVHRSVVAVTDWPDVVDTEDFFSLSMDSLQVLQLSRKLKVALSLKDLGPSSIYKNPSVALLAKYIHLTRGNTEADGSLDTDYRQDLDLMFSTYKEKIDDFLERGLVEKHELYEESTEVVVLTGSTGAVGSYVLDCLLRDPSISHIYCLNRSSNSQAVQEKRNAERGLPTSFPSDRVTFLTTDLGSYQLGLEKADYNKIASSATQIIHNSWPVNFNQSLQSFRPSLDQLWNLISFAASARFRPSLLFLSSISAVTHYHTIAGAEDQVPEETIKDSSCPPGIGYGQSKFIGERILDHAATKLGVKTGAARVGQVAGPATSPWGWNRQEWFPSLVITSRNLGALPKSLGSFEDSARDGGLMDAVDWVPIDQLAPVLIELSSNLSSATPATGLSMFHPLNPSPRDWKTLAPVVADTLAATLTDTGDVAAEVRLVDYTEWLELLRTKLEGLNDASREQLLADFPAIKLFDFFEDTLIIKGKEQVPRALAIEKATAASPSLRLLAPLKDEWMQGWTRAWVS